MDHLERAKRKEEIPLLKEAFEADKEDDKVMWRAREQDRIKQAVADREAAVKVRDRLLRMKDDKEAYLDALLKARKRRERRGSGRIVYYSAKSFLGSFQSFAPGRRSLVYANILVQLNYRIQIAEVWSCIRKGEVAKNYLIKEGDRGGSFSCLKLCSCECIVLVGCF